MEGQSETPLLTPGDAFEVHRQMVIALFIATFLLSIGLSAGLYFSRVTALMVVAVAGGLGGFVSALRRLYAFQRVFPSNFFGKSRGVSLYLLVYSLIPPLVGIIAAVILYLIFAGSLITGDLFPKFHAASLGRKADDFQDFVANWQPILPTDYAKAIVWGFIAGFSERFVPDILGRLGSAEPNAQASKETGRVL